MQEQVQTEKQVDHQDVPTLKLSRDPNKAIEEMMLTIDKLRETLIEETKVLLEMGADINGMDKNGATPGELLK